VGGGADTPSNVGGGMASRVMSCTLDVLMQWCESTCVKANGHCVVNGNSN